MSLADSGMWLDFVIIHENSWNNASYGDDSPYSPSFQWRHSEETIIHPDDLIVFYWNYSNNDIMKISAGNQTWLAMFIPPRKKHLSMGKWAINEECSVATIAIFNCKRVRQTGLLAANY